MVNKKARLTYEYLNISTIWNKNTEKFFFNQQ